MLGLGLGVDKPVGNVEEVEFFPVYTYESSFSQNPEDFDGWEEVGSNSAFYTVGNSGGRNDTLVVGWVEAEENPWAIQNTTAIPEISDQAGLNSLATISFDVLMTNNSDQPDIEVNAWLGDRGITGTQFSLTNNVIEKRPNNLDSWITVSGTCNIAAANTDAIIITLQGEENMPQPGTLLSFYNIRVTVEDRS